MSKTTLRKRIALTATTALFAGMLSVASAPVASAAVPHVAVGEANAALTQASDSSTYVATAANSGGAAVIAPMGTAVTAAVITNARSTRLLSKDTSTGTAQTLTMLTSGVLSLYANATTTTAFSATNGSFSSATATSFGGLFAAATYGDPSTKTILTVSGNANIAATAIAVLWTAPSSAGTYTISKYTSFDTTVPTIASPSSGTLTGQITVTVVAASAGGSYSAAYSGCFTKLLATDQVGIAAIAAADSTSSNVVNGAQWYIGYALRDGYSAALASGSIVATATNGGIVSIGSDGAAVSAGTASTVVAYGTGAASQVRVDQPTAGAPLTTTVTITYNGTTVCTKTVTIAGSAASVSISNVATGDISSTTTNANWLSDTYTSGAASGRDGHYYVTLKDSAGNNVKPTSSAEFSMDPATTTTTVTALAVNSSVATATSSTDPFSKSVGTFTCGPAAGSSAVKLRHTSASTGVTISSAAFTARCADNPYTYTVSTDKAAYSQGEIGTMTVQFLDSKGNKANSIIAVGAVSMIMPMLTIVTATGSATTLTDVDGVIKYTFTVGTSTGMTAGTYTGIVDFTDLTAVAAVKATPTYKLSTGTSDVAFSEILKSVVALIASINKQIQALQKLILKR
jgi:hypothetical protein